MASLHASGIHSHLLPYLLDAKRKKWIQWRRFQSEEGKKAYKQADNTHTEIPVRDRERDLENVKGKQKEEEELGP